MNFLSKTISSLTGPSLPFYVGEPIDSSNITTIWAIHEGTIKQNSAKCTVFVCENERYLPIARNMLSKLKKLRLPGILKLLESVETDTAVYIATEPVTPLNNLVSEYSEDTKLWGFNQILNAVATVNQQASIVHAGLASSNVFVTRSGYWVLGGMEVSTQINSPEQTLYQYGTSVPGLSNYFPPEVQKGGFNVAHKSPFVIDSYELGALLYELFNGSLHGLSATSKGKVPQQLANFFRGLVNGNPNMRYTPESAKKVGTEPLTRNGLTAVSDNISNITISDNMTALLAQISATMAKFPPQFRHYEILPQLIKAVQITIAPTTTTLLNPAAIVTRLLELILASADGLNEEEYKKTVVPCIVALFQSRDRTIRLELLKNMSKFVKYLDKRIVSDKIFTSYATGFSDTEPLIRSHTLQTVEMLTDKLNDRVINGELLRLLAKIQNDVEPDMRANTTILLGKIANKFASNSRTNVLVAAFSRALKDPYEKSRLAALLAVSATIDLYPVADCAARLLGLVAPGLLDKSHEVRVQANTTLEQLLDKIRREATLMDEGKAPSNTVAGNVASYLFAGNSSASSRPGSAPIAPSTASPDLIQHKAIGSVQSDTHLSSQAALPPTASVKTEEVVADISGWGDSWDLPEDQDFGEDEIEPEVKNLSLEPEEDGEADGWDNWA